MVDVNGADAWLDCNESPLGPAPSAVARIRAHAHELHRYPRGLTEAVTSAAAATFAPLFADVLLTNGVDEAIELVALEAQTVWTVTPGFHAYAERARVLGREVRTIPLDGAWNPTRRPGRGVVFLAQPHSPTGNFFPADWLAAVIAGADLVFLDTTYEDFADPADRLSGIAAAVAESRLVVFRSFSKSHGLAGLRLGAVAGSRPVIERLRARQRPEAVNSVALHALAGALDEPGHQRALRAYVRAVRPLYAAALSACPLFDDVRETQANFVLARCRGVPAAAVVAALAVRGVRVSDCTAFGLDGWVRAGVGTEADLARLTGALAAAAGRPAQLGGRV